jgi:AcrR family transcriptional regulator
MPRSGEHTRERILERATHVASAGGLRALTIGGLASGVGVSKGAVANHFPSKTDLQLRTIEAAASVVEARIASRALDAEPGLPRLRAAVDAWLDYLADPPFEGGCFFCTTTIESGTAEGEIRDTLALAARLGLDLLFEQARLAQRLGELDEHPSAEQLVFELHAFLQEANWARRLFDDSGAINQARTAIAVRLTRRKRQ